MQLMRKRIHGVHLWLSLPIGIFFFVVCFSGAILVFEKEIREATHPELYFVKQNGGHRLKPSELVFSIRPYLSDTLQVASIQYDGAPNRTCMVTFTGLRGRTLTVNPYTGQIMGWEVTNSGFFHVSKKLHRSLLETTRKGEFSWGKTVVGVITLISVIVMITGLFIWIPRNRKMCRNRLNISFSRGARRFWYDTHVVGGFYALAFLLLMALTGLTWSFRWYRTGFYALFGAKNEYTTLQKEKPTIAHKEHQKDGEGGIDKKRQAKKMFKVWDKAMKQVEERYPSYRYFKIEKDKVQIAADTKNSMRKLDTLEFDARTGKVKSLTLYANKPQEQKMKGLIYALHTGLWGGIWSKILTFVAALIGAILPLTGYYLWWKKR